jgi:hypothetical protein
MWYFSVGGICMYQTVPQPRFPLLIAKPIDSFGSRYNQLAASGLQDE